MSLTIESAKRNVRNYYDLNNPNEDDDFLFTESLEYLIHKTNQSNYMIDLGGWYYARKQFNLAEQYYLMAAELNDSTAYECLGYIYYYGRTAEPNYEKAFKYYQLASKTGNIAASYKLADMYRNGYYVEKDYDKYSTIIKSLYSKVKDATNVFDPLPEIYSRLAKIYVKEDKIEEAIELLLTAKDFLAQRLHYNSFFGDLTIMKYIVNDLYKLIRFIPNQADLFDLYYVLQYPSKVIISAYGIDHVIETKKENDVVYITMDNQNYENIDEFFSRALIHNKHISSLYYEIDEMEIQSWNSQK